MVVVATDINKPYQKKAQLFIHQEENGFQVEGCGPTSTDWVSGVSVWFIVFR